MSFLLILAFTTTSYANLYDSLFKCSIFELDNRLTKSNELIIHPKQYDFLKSNIADLLDVDYTVETTKYCKTPIESFTTHIQDEIITASKYFVESVLPIKPYISSDFSESDINELDINECATIMNKGIEQLSQAESDLLNKSIYKTSDLFLQFRVSTNRQ